MTIRLALVCDYVEERWPSMDLVGEMILAHLQARHAGAVAPTRICPAFRRRARARNVDRLINRFYDYPKVTRRLARGGEFDLFHLVDHSYAQLVHEMPAGRAVVTCCCASSRASRARMIMR